MNRADALVLFAEDEKTGGGGRHVEFGMALGLRKGLIVVGTVENLLQRLPDVHVVDTWEDALQILVGD